MSNDATHPAITFDRQSVDKFAAMIGRARRIVLTCHMSPDGDALGSTLGMAHVLRAMGKDARVIVPDEPPHTLKVLPGAKKIMAWSSFGTIAEASVAKADLILCMDFNAPSRLSRLESPVMQSPAQKILIDHHLDPEDFAALTFSYPGASSTCQVAFSLALRAGYDRFVTQDAATCFMGGILTDTGGLRYNSNEPGLYTAISSLMAKGVDKDRLSRCLLDTQSADSMRLEAFAIDKRMRLYAAHHAALTVLDRDDLTAYNYRKGDTEGLVNRALGIPGIVYSCYLRQEKDYVKVSMRSLGDFPVNLLCREHFGGGGHLNAAGGEFDGTLQQAADLFESLLDQNMQLITPATLAYADRRPAPENQN